MEIEGGIPLRGTINISGAKNLALPAMVLGLMTDKPLVLCNVPDLADTRSLIDLLRHLGTHVSYDNGKILLYTKDLQSEEAPYDFVRKMRASILVLGPLLGRYGKAKVSLPGGCAIGARGVDLHIKAMEALGANIEIENGYISAFAPKGLTGTDIIFEKVTVTGTENVLMASVFANGQTRIINAAIEPEIVALSKCLQAMGGNIDGIGTSVLTVNGVNSLGAAEFRIIPDRIETGTYAIAAAITGGSVLLKNHQYDDLLSFWDALTQTGAVVEQTENGVLVSRDSEEILPYDIQTSPYPGFPTDLQAQFMALMTLCNGSASITENIFENRFMHVPELTRLGANISVVGKTALVTGVKKLEGASVMATDLRASVSLVLAALAATGKTTVNRLYHLDRGYENIDEKLKSCGGRVKRIPID